MRSRLGLLAVPTVMTAMLSGCSGGGSNADAPLGFTSESTRLCAIVPARDPAAGAFPQEPPVEIFGTDLGWTYEVNGRVPILFGDTWQRIDICPIQVNDDSLGELHLPSDEWPGFTARESIPDEQCPEITYELDEAGTSFAPITLQRWDGLPVPLGPLNTPVTAFFDGVREWAFFIVAGGQTCSAEEAADGTPCAADRSAQAADLRCGFVAGQPRCVDPSSTRHGDAAQAYDLHLAERVGPTAYVSRAIFLTNKYLNLTARSVRAFDAEDPGGRDYATGHAALLAWGRPGFEDLGGDGDAPPYFLYHPLPLAVSGERVEFAPRYFTGRAPDGRPRFGSDQAEATPLYTDEFEPVNHASVSWLPSLRRWLMIYGGSSTDFSDPERRTGRGQPIPGAMYARLAAEPWGPWSEPQPVLTNEQAAPDLVCGHQAPAGCLAMPDPPIRPACIEAVDPAGGGNLYGASIIEPMTRSLGDGGAAVFWLYSAWHPYTVVLVRTTVALD